MKNAFPVNRRPSVPFLETFSRPPRPTRTLVPLSIIHGPVRVGGDGRQLGVPRAGTRSKRSCAARLVPHPPRCVPAHADRRRGRRGGNGRGFHGIHGELLG